MLAATAVLLASIPEGVDRGRFRFPPSTLSGCAQIAGTRDQKVNTAHDEQVDGCYYHLPVEGVRIAYQTQPQWPIVQE